MRFVFESSLERFALVFLVVGSELLILGAWALLKRRRYKVSAVLAGAAGIITLPLGILSLVPAFSLWRYETTGKRLTGQQALAAAAIAIVGTLYFVVVGVIA